MACQPDGTTTVPAPLACIHIDAHTDTWDTLYGEQLSHGAPFRRAVEAGLLDPSKVSGGDGEQGRRREKKSKEE